MMKKLLLVLALGAFGYSASAQDVKPLRLQLNLGSTHAVGDFSSTDMESESSGYAKSGGFFSIGLMKDINPNFGLGLTLGGRTNELDTKSFEEQAEDEGYFASVEGDGYSSAHLVADFYGQLPLNKTTLYAKASAGFGSFTIKEMEMTISDGDNFVKMSREELTANSLVFGIGGGFRYDFGKFGLGLEVVYMTAKPEFEADGDSYEQPYGTINSTIGLAYRIN